jgi:ABC-2 type transport system permease protein
MKKIRSHIVLQWKLDIRNKNVFLPFYIIPFVFFIVMGFVFTSIIPGIEETLISAMIVFAVVMGTSLGQTTPISEIYGSDIIKAYKLGNIPISIPLIVSVISSAIHITIISLVIFFVCPLLFGSPFPSNLLVFFLAYLFFLLASLGIGSFIGTHFKSTSGLVMAGQIVFIPSIMLSGIMFSIDLLPTFLKNFAYIFPATLGNIIMTSSNINWLFMLVLFLVFISTFTVSLIKIRKMD